MSLLQNFVGKRVNIKASGSAELFEIKSVDEETLEVVVVGENRKTQETFKVFDLTTLRVEPAVQENIVTRIQALEAAGKVGGARLGSAVKKKAVAKKKKK